MMYGVTADRLNFCRSIHIRFFYVRSINMEDQVLIERNCRRINVIILRSCGHSIGRRAAGNGLLVSELSPVFFRILNEIFLIHGIRVKLERVRFHVFFKCLTMLFRNNPGTGKAVVPSVLHNDLRITKITGRYFFIKHFRCQNRIIDIFLKCYSAVIRNRKTLSLSVRLCCCIHKIELAVFHDRVAGAASAYRFILFIRYKGDGKGFPCHKVGGCHMQPVHRTPL